MLFCCIVGGIFFHQRSSKTLTFWLFLEMPLWKQIKTAKIGNKILQTFMVKKYLYAPKLWTAGKTKFWPSGEQTMINPLSRTFCPNSITSITYCEVLWLDCADTFFCHWHMAALLLSLCDQKMPYLSIYTNGQVKFLIVYTDTATASTCCHFIVAYATDCVPFVFINRERI